MPDALDLFELPKVDEMYMIAGWRQWADAGSVSSGLPEYLIQLTDARPLGEIHNDGFYLFQIPGTHNMVRPLVKFDQGYPVSLDTQHNQFFYAENSRRGVVIFLGDEPHIDAERYVRTLLDAAKQLRVKRIVGLGGVYGMVPYDKERMISCNYSLPWLKEQMTELSVSLTEYHGGASIGSYLCRKAGEQGIEYVGLYGFVPLYDLSGNLQINKTVRVENDYTAWLGILRRINFMFKTNFDVSELNHSAARLVRSIRSQLEEIEHEFPQLSVDEYLRKLTDDFTEMPFIPLDDVWEENLKQIFDKLDEDPDDLEQVDHPAEKSFPPMTIRRKAKKSAINEFVSMIVPDRIEEAYGRVEEYFNDHLNLSFDSPEGVAEVLDELIRQNGESVRNALYTLLCEPQSALRAAADSAMGGGAKSAVGIIVPLLVAQFALAPAVALLVATLVIKALAVRGENAVCEGLVTQHRKTVRRIRQADHKRAEQSRPKIPRRTVKRAPDYRGEHPAAGSSVVSSERPGTRRSGTTGNRTSVKTDSTNPASSTPLKPSRRAPKIVPVSPQGKTQRKSADQPAAPRVKAPKSKPKSGE